MKTNVAMDKTGLQQVLVKIDAELAATQRELEQAQTALASGQKEIEALDSRSMQRNQSLQLASQTVSQLQTELEAQRTRANLQVGTLVSDRVSTKDLEKKLSKASHELQQMRLRLGKEETADADRRAILQTQLPTHQQQVQQCNLKMESLLHAKKSTYQDLGQAIYNEQTSLLKEAQSEVLQAEHLARQARAKYAELSNTATNALTAWRPLQRELQTDLAPHTDASTELLETELRILDLLSQKGIEITMQLHQDLLRKIPGLAWSSLPGLLASEERMYYGAFATTGNTIKLTEKRRQFQQLLEVYRDGKRGA